MCVRSCSCSCAAGWWCGVLRAAWARMTYLVVRARLALWADRCNACTMNSHTTTEQSDSVQGPFDYYGPYWLAVRADGTYVKNAFGKVHWASYEAAQAALNS